MKKVVDRLQEYNLKLKLKKMSIYMRYYHILRHEISIRGVSVHQDHFDPIRYSKTQTTKKKVKKFMGTPTYFRTFVKNFTELAEPITKLLS